MGFDPDKYLSTGGFDPDEYLGSKSSAFDPDAYLSEEKPEGVMGFISNVLSNMPFGFAGDKSQLGGPLPEEERREPGIYADPRTTTQRVEQQETGIRELYKEGLGPVTKRIQGVEDWVRPESPVTQGAFDVAKGVSEYGENLATPENAALLALGALVPPAGAAIAATAVPQILYGGIEKFREGGTKNITQGIMDMILGVGMPIGAKARQGMTMRPKAPVETPITPESIGATPTQALPIDFKAKPIIAQSRPPEMPLQGPQAPVQPMQPLQTPEMSPMETVGAAIKPKSPRPKGVGDTVEFDIEGTPISGKVVGKEYSQGKVSKLRVNTDNGVVSIEPSKIKGAAPIPEVKTAEPFMTTETPTSAIPSAEITQPTPIKEAVSGPVMGKPTKVAIDINRTLAEKGFEELPMEEMSRYTPKAKQFELDRVSKVMADGEIADQMAVGKIPVKDADPQVLFNAVKNKAMETDNVDLLRDLANSPIGKERSEAAQKMSMASINSNPHDTVNILHQVTKTNEKYAAKKWGDIGEAKKQIAKEIKAEIAKNKPNKLDWAGFVESIRCK